MFGWFMILGTAVMQKYGLFPNPDVPLQYKDWGALTQQVRHRLGRGLGLGAHRARTWPRPHRQPRRPRPGTPAAPRLSPYPHRNPHPASPAPAPSPCPGLRHLHHQRARDHHDRAHPRARGQRGGRLRPAGARSQPPRTVRAAGELVLQARWGLQAGWGLQARCCCRRGGAVGEVVVRRGKAAVKRPAAHADARRRLPGPGLGSGLGLGLRLGPGWPSNACAVGGFSARQGAGCRVQGAGWRATLHP